jgi:hypothetical protein
MIILNLKTNLLIGITVKKSLMVSDGLVVLVILAALAFHPVSAIVSTSHDISNRSKHHDTG